MTKDTQRSTGSAWRSADAAGQFKIAIAHHQAGRLREAELHYRQALAADPIHADSLHLFGVLAHQVGRSEIAVELIGKALAQNDRIPDFHYNIALAFGALGRFAEAAQHNRCAIALRPDHAQAHLNLGNALHAMGRHEKAIVSYREVLALEPNLPEGHYNIANALAALGRNDEAILQYRRALTLRPNYAEAHTNLGSALVAQGNITEAIERHREALRLNPGLATASVNLGNALRADGKLDDAIDCYRQACARDPKYAEAHNNLGVALAARGATEDAAACFRRALTLKPGLVAASVNLVRVLIVSGDLGNALAIAKQLNDAEETAETRALMFQCLRDPRALPFAEQYRAELLRAIAEPWGNPRFLVGPAVQVLERDPAIGPAIARTADGTSGALTSGDLATLAGNTLLRTLLESAQIKGAGLERLLTSARYALLTLEAAPGDVLAFACALARQCFINEFVFDLSEREAAQARTLHDDVAAAISSGTAISAQTLAVLGCYLPLHTLPGAHALLARDWPEPVRALLIQQIDEPAEEARIRTAMPRLTEIENTISQAVRAQYEENPYPRWTKTAASGKRQSVDAYLREHFPLAAFVPLRKPVLDYLIAGCGTGHQTAAVLNVFSGVAVTAVDLSLASLGCAKRMTDSLGLSGVSYGQADILKLGAIGKSFDVVECAGVLHHMAEPFAGWRVLCGLLRPGGLMRISLYSTLARRAVAAARRFIAENGWTPTVEGIRAARQAILVLPDGAPAKRVAQTGDFFSLSECRDLLFHVQEQTFGLPEIAAFLTDQRLEFLGFEIAPPVARRYAERFPEDAAKTNLDRWHIFEQENPDTFIGMYDFWVQKPDGSLQAAAQ